MGRINTGRVILGGLLAGVVIVLGDFIVNELLLKETWDATMASLNLTPIGGSAIGVFVIGSLVFGVVTIWLYAAVRPRLGPGPKTAFIVGLVVWFFGCLMAMLPPLVSGILPGSLVWPMIVGGLVEILIATLIGASLYQET